MPAIKKNVTIKNIFFSLVDKSILIGGQIFISMMTLRNLSSEDIGVIGKMVGLQVILQFLNPSLESSMFRLSSSEINTPNLPSITLLLNFLKLILFTMIGVLFLFLQSPQDGSEYYAFCGLCLIIASETLHNGMTFFSTIKFNHQTVTKISFYRIIFNCLSVSFLISYPDLQTYLLKEIANFFFLCVLWRINSIQKLDSESFRLFRDNFQSVVGLIIKNFRQFGIWNHLINSSTQFIYRVDTYFLSFFASLSTVGQYNIALNAANSLSIFSGVFSTQNNVSLHHALNDSQVSDIHSKFFRFHIYLFIIWISSSFLFAKPILMFFSGQNFSQDMVHNFLWISCGLALIKTIGMPLVVLIQNKGRIDQFFKQVVFPLLLITPILYYSSSKFGGAEWLAISNFIIFFIWLLTIVVFYSFHFKNIKIKLDINQDVQTLLSLPGKIYAEFKK